MSSGFMVPVFALRSTAIGTAILILKIYVALLIQGGKRFFSGSRPPEDEKLAPKAGAQSFDGSAKLQGKEDNAKLKYRRLQELRWTRIVANDLENIPIGLIAAWGSLFSCYDYDIHGYLVIGFTALRLLHTVSYAYELQPHRALAWGGAALCIFGMCANSIAGTFK